MLERGGGIGGGGTVKNHKSEERCFFPVRKGRVEVGVSKRKTEVELKTAWPWGRRRGEIPTREWDKEESGRK